MKRQILLLITSSALLLGCDSKEKVTAAPSRVLATIEAPKQPPQLNNAKLQSVSAAPTDLANLAIGEKVYKSTCSICHQSGLNGAPRVGSKKDWEARLAQGNEVLYTRAINGYRGSKGNMPSRGSNPRLSEAEVKAAVDYIVANAIPSWSVE